MTGHDARDPESVALIGLEESVELVRRHAAEPTNAYMFVGSAPGALRALATEFAQALVAAANPTDAERHLRLAQANAHPSVMTIERAGASLLLAQAKEATSQGAHMPTDGAVQLLVFPEAETIATAAGALLKAVEEAVQSTVFLFLATEITPELVTIASRCVVIQIPTPSLEGVQAQLIARGFEEADIAGALLAAGGDAADGLDLLEDPSFQATWECWSTALDRLDGSGFARGCVLRDLLADIEAAAGRLKDEQGVELKAFDADESISHSKGARAALEAAHERRARQVRSAALMRGLRIVAAAARERNPSVVAVVGAASAHLLERQEFNPRMDLSLLAFLISVDHC